MKFKWEKDEGGRFAVEKAGYSGYVEVAGADLFGNRIVEASLFGLEGIKRIDVDGLFTATADAKRAIERAIAQDMEAAR